MSDANAPFVPPSRRSIGRMSFVSATPGCKVVVSEVGAPPEVAEPPPEVQAKQMMEALKHQHAAELEKVKKEAYQQGFADGQKDREPAIQTLKNELSENRNMLPGVLNEYFAELEEGMRDEIVNFSLRIAESVLMSHLEDADRIGMLIREALKPLLNLNNVKLHLNPVYLEKDGIKDSVPSGVTLLADPSLEKGKVIAESPQGFIETGFTDRLDLLRKRLLRQEEGDSSNVE